MWIREWFQQLRCLGKHCEISDTRTTPGSGPQRPAPGSVPGTPWSKPAKGEPHLVICYVTASQWLNGEECSGLMAIYGAILTIVATPTRPVMSL